MSRKRNDHLADAMFLATMHLTVFPDLPPARTINSVWHEADGVAGIDVNVDYRAGFAGILAWAASLDFPPITVRQCPQGSTELAVNKLALGYSPVKAWMHLHRRQRALLWDALPGGEPEVGKTVVVPLDLARKLAVAEAEAAETVKAAEAAEMAPAQ